MDDGWGLHFVRRTRKSELIGRNQSPVGTLGSKTQELVAPSGCCLASGIDARRSERVGSSKQGYNDQTHFCPPFSSPLLSLVKRVYQTFVGVSNHRREFFGQLGAAGVSARDLAGLPRPGRPL